MAVRRASIDDKRKLFDQPYQVYFEIENTGKNLQGL
jgi:hypothetical protein